MKFKTRFFEDGDLALRVGEGDTGRRLVGYAVRWDKPSADLGGFVERFERGAFSDVLGGDVAALVDHDMSKLIGRTSAGTLRLAEDEQGLRYEVDPLPDTTIAHDLRENVRLGNIRGSSFAFLVAPGGERVEKERSADGMIVRTVTKVSRLRDVGPVTFPAYPDSSAALRDLQGTDEHEQPAPVPSPPETPTEPPPNPSTIEIDIALLSLLRF